jgi:exoribonuclease R
MSPLCRKTEDVTVGCSNADLLWSLVTNFPFPKESLEAGKFASRVLSTVRRFLFGLESDVHRQEEYKTHLVRVNAAIAAGKSFERSGKVPVRRSGCRPTGKNHGKTAFSPLNLRGTLLNVVAPNESRQGRVSCIVVGAGSISTERLIRPVTDLRKSVPSGIEQDADAQTKRLKQRTRPSDNTGTKQVDVFVLRPIHADCALPDLVVPKDDLDEMYRVFCESSSSGAAPLLPDACTYVCNVYPSTLAIDKTGSLFSRAVFPPFPRLAGTHTNMLHSGEQWTRPSVQGSIVACTGSSMSLQAMQSEVALAVAHERESSNEFAPAPELAGGTSVHSGRSTVLADLNSVSTFPAPVEDELIALKAEVLAAGDKGIWPIPASEVAIRMDLRDMLVLTIDPTSARDLDDAVHMVSMGKHRIRRDQDTWHALDKVLQNSSPSNTRARAPSPTREPAFVERDLEVFEVGVHIADVSFFVRPNSKLDREAMSRATSVYLPDRVLPMLPRILSETVCSLNPHVDRLAFTCIFHVDANGALVQEGDISLTPSKNHRDGALRLLVHPFRRKPGFYRSIIRCAARLDYGVAQAMMDNIISSTAIKDNAVPGSLWPIAWRPEPQCRHDMEAVRQAVCLMGRIFLQRRALRKASGNISLHKVKLAVEFDDSGKVRNIADYHMRQSNQVVEEMMLCANFLSAQTLVQKANLHAFVRVHDPPRSKHLDHARAFARCTGFLLDTSSRQALQHTVDAAVSRDPLLGGALLTLTSRAMQRARYTIVADAINGEQKDGTGSLGHFALVMPFYTHFTSPIRRYADVIVHRMLAGCTISTPPSPLLIHSGATLGTWGSAMILQSIANHCNSMRHVAKNAEDSARQAYLALFLREKYPTGLESVAVVVSIRKRAQRHEIELVDPAWNVEEIVAAEEHGFFPRLAGTSHSIRPYVSSFQSDTSTLVISCPPTVFEISADSGVSERGNSLSQQKISVGTKLKIRLTCSETSLAPAVQVHWKESM